jgi:hypothetical protein
MKMIYLGHKKPGSMAGVVLEALMGSSGAANLWSNAELKPELVYVKDDGD